MNQPDEHDDKTEHLARFQAVSEYRRPAMPVDEVVWRLYDRFKRLLRKEVDAPFIAEDNLQRTTRGVLDDVVAPPACGPLLDELDFSFKDWRPDSSIGSLKKLVILPPCDENDVMAAWANRNGYDSLIAPERDSLISTNTPVIPELDGDGILVIPNLERWFLRHHNGLHTVKRLLAAIDAVQRRCLVGCGSWGWAFLARAIGAGMILPESKTFQAFDAKRLERWFSELAASELTEDVTFRLSSTGETVLALEGETQAQGYFQRLAAHSLGIPWVAWHLWRRSLRSNVDPEEMSNSIASEAHSKAKFDGNTLWISEIETFELPSNHQQDALLVVQALLIHGALTAKEISIVLPAVRDSNIIFALINSGIVEQSGDRIRCRPSAYPSIRNAMASAGFPMDVLHP